MIPSRHSLLLSLLPAICLLFATSQASASCSIDQGNKYTHQIYKLLVPEDVKKYGSCNDYGYWKGGTYKNHTGIPPGYWVYAEPYWYVWAEKTGVRSQAENEGCSTTQGGKYSQQLHKLYLPTDEKKYGRCHDYGWWSGKSYAGYKNLNDGYWVFAYPNWYIWGRKN